MSIKKTIVIRKCAKRNGEIIWDPNYPEYSERLAVIQAPSFVREIYNHMNKEMPVKTKEISDRLLKVNENLEDLLFFGRSSRDKPGTNITSFKSVQNPASGGY